MKIHSKILNVNDSVYVSPFGQFSYKEKQICLVRGKFATIIRNVRMDFYVIGNTQKYQ